MDLLQREKAKTSSSFAPLSTGESTSISFSSEMLPSHSQCAEDLEVVSAQMWSPNTKRYTREDMSAFAAFMKKERDQRYKELGLRDKIILSNGHFLLGNKKGTKDTRNWV